MEWDKGFSATYYATIVDPQSWRDISRFEITEGAIKREDDGLYQSADITCTEWDTTKEQWIRIYLEAKQDGSGERHALFTGLATSPESNVNGTLTEFPLECYSVLKPAEDILLQRGWYAPSGVPGTQIIAKMLEACPCPVVINEESPNLQDAIIAEDGESNLSMCHKVLTAIDWRLRILGDGTIQVMPQSDEPVTMFDPNSADVVEPQIELTNDWFDCPNVFRAVSDDLFGVARDDDPDSPLSTVNRGREVWMEETDCDYNEGETIGDYAVRRLKEEQNYYLKVSYNRRYNPDVLPTDLIRLHYPQISGVFRVNSQDISLGYGATTSEEVSNGE